MCVGPRQKGAEGRAGGTLKTRDKLYIQNEVIFVFNKFINHLKFTLVNPMQFFLNYKFILVNPMQIIYHFKFTLDNPMQFFLSYKFTLDNPMKFVPNFKCTLVNPLLFIYHFKFTLHSGKLEFEDDCSNKGLTFHENCSAYFSPQIPVRLN